MLYDLAIKLLVIVVDGLLAALLVWGITALDEADDAPSLPTPIPTGAA